MYRQTILAVDDTPEHIDRLIGPRRDRYAVKTAADLSQPVNPQSLGQAVHAALKQ